MRVCVLGLGYIGLPTASIIAKSGHDVVGVEIDRNIVDGLNNGRVHITSENGLVQIVEEVIKLGRLRVSHKPEDADVYVIAVPTPLSNALRSTHLADEHRMEVSPSADLSFVEAAVRDVAQYLRRGNLVILESTVPPGTTVGLVKRLLEATSGLLAGRDFFLAHAPERVLPGNILKEIVSNDRVIGGVDSCSTKKAVDFYKTFVMGEVYSTDATTAELVKLMENTYRDVNIALANEMALLCEELGADIWEAIGLANRHPRVNYLKPGPGVGGHCIAVDPYFLISCFPDRTNLIRVSRAINEGMPQHVVETFCQFAKAVEKDGFEIRKIAVLGVAYKANVEDARESPALEIVERLRDITWTVEVHDPYVYPYRMRQVEECLQNSDALLMLTDHSIYRGLTPGMVTRLVRNKFVFDARGFFGREWDDNGFVVCRLGARKTASPHDDDYTRLR